MAEKQEELKLLADTFLFRGIGQEELARYLTQVTVRRESFRKHEIIYRQDTFRRELGIVLKGTLRVTRGELLVSELTAGELFGAAALFNEEERYVSCLTAREPAEILFLSQASMEALMALDGRIAVNYIAYLSERIRFLSRKIDALTQDSGLAKLSDWLLTHMDGEGQIEKAGSMTELARRLDISRATLYRELEQLQRREIICREGQRIRVLRPEQLKEK